MIALVAAVFVASVLGSLHCAGMCGAFVAFAVSIDAPKGVNPRGRLQAAYNIGRLLTYATLGSIAGGLGGAFDAAGQLMGVQRAAVMLAGMCMVVFGSIAILRLNGVHIPKPRTPKFLERTVTNAIRAAVEKPPVARAFLTGTITTLLPCGWLYAFVITAAGTGNPVHGALTMVVFWAGTLPMLIAIGTGVQAIASRLGRFGRRVPVIVASVVVCIGMLNVFDPQRLEGALVLASRTPTRTDLISHVKSLKESDMPCCHEHAEDQQSVSDAR